MTFPFAWSPTQQDCFHLSLLEDFCAKAGRSQFGQENPQLAISGHVFFLGKSSNWPWENPQLAASAPATRNAATPREAASVGARCHKCHFYHDHDGVISSHQMDPHGTSLGMVYYWDYHGLPQPPLDKSDKFRATLVDELGWPPNQKKTTSDVKLEPPN
jgi:hypothetical protein